MPNLTIFKICSYAVYYCDPHKSNKPPLEGFTEALQRLYSSLSADVKEFLDNSTIVDACTDAVCLANRKHKLKLYICRGTANFADVIFDDIPIALATLGRHKQAQKFGLYRLSKQLFNFFDKCDQQFPDYIPYSTGHSRGAFPAIMLHLYGRAVQCIVFNPAYVPDIRFHDELFGSLQIKPTTERIITMYRTKLDIVSGKYRLRYRHTQKLGVEIIEVNGEVSHSNSMTSEKDRKLSCQIYHCPDQFQVLPNPKKAHGYLQAIQTIPSAPINTEEQRMQPLYEQIVCSLSQVSKTHSHHLPYSPPVQKVLRFYPTYRATTAPPVISFITRRQLWPH